MISLLRAVLKVMSYSLTFSVLRKAHIMFWRPLTLCSLNYVTETVQVTEGSMLANPALVDGYRCSAERAASVLTALVYGRVWHRAPTYHNLNGLT
jgi:hypothetical protein